jgi:hypothetical protein
MNPEKKPEKRERRGKAKRRKVGEGKRGVVERW